jgi:peptide/nickel transport system permease protein
MSSRWRRHKGAAVALGVVLLACFLAIFAPLLPISNATAISLSHPMLPPLSHGHLLGTDDLGRDELSRLIWGIRPALLEGVLPVVFATAIGTTIGGVAGFVGGLVDSAAMRLIDVFLAIPAVMMGIAVAATLGSGLRNVVIAMTLVLVPPLTRVARGAVVEIRNKPYVRAARSLGARDRTLLLRHVLPNAASPILAYAFTLIGLMIVFAAGLSFIGLGVQPPSPDWGAMVNGGRLYLATAPWLAIAPGAAIFVVGLAFGQVGVWADDALGAR